MTFQPSRTLGRSLPSIFHCPLSSMSTAWLSLLFASGTRRAQAGTLPLLAVHGGGVEELRGRSALLPQPVPARGSRHTIGMAVHLYSPKGLSILFY